MVFTHPWIMGRKGEDIGRNDMDSMENNVYLIEIYDI